MTLVKYSTNTITKKKSSFDVKGYHVFYQDSKPSTDNIIESRLLKSKKYNLKGKPDFILKHNNKNLYIPIELKSGKIKDEDRPHEGDFLQLITYFLLIEEEFNQKPLYGKIIYSDYMFIIKNKKAYKKKLLITLNQMRTLLKTGKIKYDKQSFVKCKHCLCNNTVCEVNK